MNNSFRIICLLFICLYCPEICNSSEIIYENTTRSGNISSDERWKGVIVVTGDVTVINNATLTIEPGAIVRMAANSDDQRNGPDTPVTDYFYRNDPPSRPSQMCSIGVYGGNLIAIGTSDKKILFTSSSSNPIRGDWHSIQYNKFGSKLVLDNAIMEYSYHGLQINDKATEENITIENTIIRHVVTCCICSGPNDRNGQMSIKITNNDISDCGHEAIDTHVDGFIIENNYIHDNLWSFGDGPSGGGVVIDKTNITVKNNIFENNRVGINVLEPNTQSLVSGNIYINNDTNCLGDCTFLSSAGNVKDSKPIIILRDASTGENGIWYMHGVAKSGGDLLPPVADNNWKIVGAGDFNADGELDILWRNAATGDNYVWYMNGIMKNSGDFLPLVADNNWSIVGVGDFNGDGKADILWRNAVTGDNYVWYMNGVTKSGGNFLPLVADNNWAIVGVGDFNSDGKADILWRNAVTGDNYVWYMNGIMKNGGDFLLPVADYNWKIVGASDFNGDGKTDILWRNAATGDNYVWYMNGIMKNSGDFLPYKDIKTELILVNH